MRSPPSGVCAIVGVSVESTGKFWRPFAPVSPSPGSFGVVPSVPSAMPRPKLSWMELARMEAPVTFSFSTNTPCPDEGDVPLYAITFASPAPVPPILRPEPTM